ncbi:putative transcription factor MADS-type1 family [Medicago truncatula]|nr:putative transcription factor MADS-type1 family [Medicago truncatula]
MKMIKELSILCGIEACAIISDENHHEAEVWPSPTEVVNVLSRFKNLSEHEQGKRMLDLESYLKQRIEKTQDQYHKLKMENKKKEMAGYIEKYMCTKEFNFGDAHLTNPNDFTDFINEQLKEVKQKLDSMDFQAQEDSIDFDDIDFDPNEFYLATP